MKKNKSLKDKEAKLDKFLKKKIGTQRFKKINQKENLLKNGYLTLWILQIFTHL